MRKLSPLVLFIGLLALAALACSATSSSDGGTVDSATTAPTVLFKDDFSDSGSGWSVYSDAEGTNEYADGGYRIFVNKSLWYFWANPERNFTDVIVEVDGKKIGGPDANDYGIICRYKDEGNFYFFTIGSDGYYAVRKFFEGGEETFVGMDEMQFNDSVLKGGDAVNHIKATCKGSSLTLEVNGTVLADVIDSDLTSGDVGLIAGSYEEAGVDIQFDNFVVTKP